MRVVRGFGALVAALSLLSGSAALAQVPTTTTTTTVPTTTTTATTSTTTTTSAVPATTTTSQKSTTTTRKTTTTAKGATTTTSSTIPATTTSAGLPIAQGPTPDIKLTDIELTQGIQNLDNQMPMVAFRRTWVRLYVESDNAPTFTWPNIDGAILLKRGNKSQIIYAENAPIATSTPIDRTKFNATLNFVVPSAFTLAGETTFKALVWSGTPSTIDDEPESSNNQLTLTRTFKKSSEVFLYVLPLDPDPNKKGDEPLDSVMAAVPGWMGKGLLDYHPISNPTFQIYALPLHPGSEALDQHPIRWDLTQRRSEPNQRMAWLHAVWDLPEAQQIAGVFNNSLPAGGYTGWAPKGMFSFWTKQDNFSAAHEMGHKRGLAHAPCRDSDKDGLPDEAKGGGIDETFPYGLPNCSLAPTDPRGYYGFTTYHDTVQIYSNDPTSPAKAFPMMGYQGPSWSDPYHYCKMLTKYGIPCDPAAIGVAPKGANAPAKDDSAFTAPKKSSQQLIVSGFVNLTKKTGEITEVLAHPHESTSAPSVDIDAEDASPYRVAALDGAGGIIARAPLVINGAGHGGGTEDDPSHAAWIATLPVDKDVAAIRVEGANGERVVEKKASASAPTVAITAPTAGAELAREFDVSWKASDPDGGPLLSTVEWSADGGKTWQPIATGIAGSTVSVTEGLGLPGGSVQIRVLVSDGVRTGSDTSETLAVAKGKPRILLDGPTPSIPRYAIARLAASAVDPEDGVLDDVSWSSSLDGDLGKGAVVETRALSLGDHIVTAIARDKDGNTATTDIAFSVVDDGRPAPREQGALPDAERRLRPAAAVSAPEHDGGSSSRGPMILGLIVIAAAIGVGVALRRRRTVR